MVALPYDILVYLWKERAFVLTDSSLQEETTPLIIVCKTIRESAEKEITIEVGSNVSTGTGVERVVALYKCVLCGDWKASSATDIRYTAAS